ncbi:hypothetical protein P8452_00786 [Trifolium repens]|nr:hypothetical protein P8452_00786 [Trifolium repens]
MLISLLPIPNHPIINQCYFFFQFIYNGIITPIFQNFAIVAGRPNFVKEEDFYPFDYMKDDSEVSCISNTSFSSTGTQSSIFVFSVNLFHKVKQIARLRNCLLHFDVMMFLVEAGHFFKLRNYWVHFDFGVGINECGCEDSLN